MAGEVPYLKGPIGTGRFTTCDGVCSHARGGAFALYLSSGLICLVP